MSVAVSVAARKGSHLSERIEFIKNTILIKGKFEHAETCSI